MKRKDSLTFVESSFLNIFVAKSMHLQFKKKIKMSLAELQIVNFPYSID